MAISRMRENVPPRGQKFASRLAKVLINSSSIKKGKPRNFCSLPLLICSAPVFYSK